MARNYKMPIAKSNPYFEVKHSEKIKDRFFFYNNTISISLPVAIANRTGTKLDVKVLHPDTQEHVNFENTAGSIPDLVEILAKHFKLNK